MLSVEQKAVIGNQSLLATVDGAVMRLRPGHLALVPTPFRLASSDRSLIKGELPGGILISQVEIGAVILTGSGSKPVFDKDVVVHGCDYDLGAAWGWSHSSNKVMVWDDGRMVSLISDFVSPFSLQTSRVADGWAIAMQVSANDRTWSLVYSLRKVDGQWQLSRLIDVEGTICPNRGIVSSKGKVFIAFTDGSWKSVDVNQDTPRMTQ